MNERLRDQTGSETIAHWRAITFLTRRRPIRQTLTVVLVAALAPLAILAATRGIYGIRADQQRAVETVALATRQATSPGHHPLQQIETVLDLLAHNPAVLGPDCGTVLAEAVQMLATPVVIVRTNGTDLVKCSSDGSLIEQPMPKALLANGGPLVLRPEGEPLAAIIDPELLVGHIAAPQPIGGASALLTDGNGRLVAGISPPGWSDLSVVPKNGEPVTLKDSTGRNWVVAAVPLSAQGTPDTQMNLLFAHPRAGLSRQDSWYYISSFALPLLALVLASLAIWIGASHSILRWVEELRRMTGEIGEGNYRLSAERFDDAPIEVRGLAADAQRMARTIAERDRTLTEALERQQALTLELNHRVRNNLQLISSYVTLQSVRDTSDQHPNALDQVQMRVGALALVHRLLYGELERANVPAARLLAELAEMIRSEWGGTAVHTSAADMTIGIDGAIPISLAFVEAAAWTREPEQAGLNLTGASLDIEGERATLCMAFEADAGSEVLHHNMPRLMQAFARQLGGKLETRIRGTSELLCLIDIPLESLDRSFQPNIGNNPAS